MNHKNKLKMENLKKQERELRIIARGEHSDHCHVVCGNATVEKGSDGFVFINTEDSTAVIRHLLESKYLKGEEVWTKEHEDISLTGDLIRHGDVMLKKVADNKYKYIPQIEFDPFEEVIRKVLD